MFVDDGPDDLTLCDQRGLTSLRASSLAHRAYRTVRQTLRKPGDLRKGADARGGACR